MEREPHDVLPETAAHLTAFLETEHDFRSRPGLRVDEFAADRMVGTVPFDDELTNPTVQGGGPRR